MKHTPSVPTVSAALSLVPPSVPPSLSLSLSVVSPSLVAHFKFLQDNTLADAPVAELLQSLQVGTLPPCPTHANPI